MLHSTIKHITSTIFFSFLLFQTIFGQAISIDGDFTDWATNGVLLATNNGVTIKVYDSNDSLYFYISGTNLGLPRIFINTDNNPATGFNEGLWVNNGQGADALIEGAFAYTSIHTTSNGGWGWNLVQSNIPYAATPTEIELSVYIYNFPSITPNISIGAIIQDNGVDVLLPDPGPGNYVNPYEPYTIQQPLIFPLPIELISFKGKANDYFSNQLTWITGTEIDNEYFNIQKSRDGHSWEDVAIINGQGDSEIEQYYQWIDENPFEISYYRLKQTDFSGEFSFSPIINVVNEKVNEVTISPNPSDGIGRAYFKINQNNNSEKIVRLYDLMGRDLTNNIVLEQSSNEFIHFDCSMLPSGLYYLRVGKSSHPIQVIQYK